MLQRAIEQLEFATNGLVFPEVFMNDSILRSSKRSLKRYATLTAALNPLWLNSGSYSSND
ncbi:MAG TPA: hypothetical protein VE548_15475 [Nitrososphaeraceae archaeon]|jgi:hypothetical protein|nr:hypothetical protein [Nitrososphaeraceae archaeon]